MRYRFLKSLPVTGFSILLLLVSFMGGFQPNPVMAQAATDDRIESVTSTVIEMSRQRENGDLFALYDRMHPDARNVFPRQAFLKWAGNGGLPVPADDPVVLDVSFEAWTWAGNGQPYSEVARVSVEQEFEGGAGPGPAEWVLVHDGQRWRWFPNLTADEIVVLNAAVADAQDAYISTFQQDAYADIDRFWHDILAVSGRTYRSLNQLVPVTREPLDTACGVETDIALNKIYYCEWDKNVYYDPTFPDYVVGKTGEYGWTMIVAHEWGHHLQHELGIRIADDPELDGGLYPIENELQADCMAGIYAQDALARGVITQVDIDAAVGIIQLAGDFPGTHWDSMDAHGTADQRVQSFLTGFDDGFYGCHIDLDPVPVGE